jgi:hypothetical protein
MDGMGEGGAGAKKDRERVRSVSCCGLENASRIPRQGSSAEVYGIHSETGEECQIRRYTARGAEE